MAHESQVSFYRKVIQSFPKHFEGKVLDIGSLDINGGPHRLLDASEYVGVDIGPGPNINLVAHGENLDLPSNYFDVAMSSECFEHNANWRSTLKNMIRMTKEGGLVVFSCATLGREEHGTSASDGGFSAPLLTEAGVEYYENVRPKAVRRVLRGGSIENFLILVNRQHSDLLFVGVKGAEDSSQRKRLEMLRESIRTEFKLEKRRKSATRFLFELVGGDRGLRLYLCGRALRDKTYNRVLSWRRS
jgi:ubiquinone/menaquinone biosynthesis C-methylase UbiE